jgi:hypothetical protein
MEWILRLSRQFFSLFPALVIFSSLAEAQTQPTGAPKAEVKATVGVFGYDEDLHPAIGGAFAYYPVSRINVELEGLYILPRKSEQLDRYRGFAVTPSVGVDFRRAPVNFQPYGRIAYTIDHSTHWTRATTTPDAQPARKESTTNGSLGIRLGFKFYIGNRFFLYPELGVGEKIRYKATVSAGYVTSHF